MKKFICVFLLSLCISPVFAAEPLPFAKVVRVDNMLYLSGQIGTVQPFQPPLVDGGIEAETKQTMENIKQVLEDNGSSMSHIVKCTVMMADMKEWPVMNKVYASFFPDGKYPARSAFGASGLGLNARVEIECLATVN